MLNASPVERAIERHAERHAERGTTPEADALPVFPVTHSVLSAAALLADVRPDYDLGQPVECRLLSRGLTDTYLIRTAGEGRRSSPGCAPAPESGDTYLSRTAGEGQDGEPRGEADGGPGRAERRYVLRAYRAGWRSDAEVQYELDALRHLRRRGVAVAAPLAREDGSLLRTVRAPEGPRQLVLFTYAPGTSDFAGDARAARLGAAAAGIHHATDDFTSLHARPAIDLCALLDAPLRALRPLLAHRPDDWRSLAGLCERLWQRLVDLPLRELETGFCHGDVHEGNAHLDGETITFFDFDCCGPGWRAYDVAVFLWDTALNWRGMLAEGETPEQRWAAFLWGYAERRPLREIDLAAIPLFVAARQVWIMGLHAANGQDWGFGWLGDRYFDRAFTFLREWERERIV